MVRNRSCPAVSHYGTQSEVCLSDLMDHNLMVQHGSRSAETNRPGRHQAHQLELDLVPINLHCSIFLHTKHAITSSALTQASCCTVLVALSKRSVRSPLRSSTGSLLHISIPAERAACQVIRLCPQHASAVNHMLPPTPLLVVQRPAAALARRRALTAKRSSKQDFPTPESPTSSSLKR
jgi:hypothetical protein